MKLTEEMKSTISAREAEWEAADAVEDAENETRRAAIILSEAEWTIASAAGLTEAEARRTKDDQRRNPDVYRTFRDAVASHVSRRLSREATQMKEAAHSRKLELQKSRIEGEDLEAWQSRVSIIETREKARLRRRDWRLHVAYLHDCHGVPKPQSYSGTNRGNRRKQRPPAFYKARDEIKQMQADLDMLAFMFGQSEQLEQQKRSMERLGNEKWVGELETQICVLDYKLRELGERYGLPADIWDFSTDADVAQDYAILFDAVNESNRPRKITRKDVFMIWKNELARRISAKHGV